MPYSGSSDPSLPSNVLKLPEKRRRQWLHVYNSVRNSGLSDGEAIHRANGVIANSKSETLDGFIELIEQETKDMSDKETAYAPFVDYEVKADGDAGIVEGYASVFNTRDHSKDMVLPGAFTKTLSERGQHIVYIPSHDYRIHVKDIPAVPLEVREDNKGLYTKTQFFLNTAAGRDSFAVIKAYQAAKRPLGMSYTFKAQDYKNESDGRTLKAVDLFEYGHTALPMLDAARTISAKADNELQLKADGQYMMHSEEVDHAHAHGDTIHSHSHKHEANGEYYYRGHTHDHTAEQLKSIGFDHESYEKYLETRGYSEDDLKEMAKSGVAYYDNTWPIKDEQDLQAAINAWNLKPEANIKSHIINRARAINKYELIPNTWKSFLLDLTEAKAESLVSDFEDKIGRRLSEDSQKKIKAALETLNELLGPVNEANDDEDEDAKMQREIETLLASIEL